MKSAIKIIKKIMNVLCWIIIFLLVSTIVFSFINKINGDSPNIFGYSIYRVSSGSMQPKLKVGDVILDKVVDEPKELKKGDIITFKGENELKDLVVTHQIIKSPYKNEQGEWVLQTKGVANDIADSPTHISNVKGKYIKVLPFLTQVYFLFLSPWGLLIIFALLIFIFFDEIIAIGKAITGNERTAKDAKKIDEIINDIKNKTDGE